VRPGLPLAGDAPPLRTGGSRVNRSGGRPNRKNAARGVQAEGGA